MGESDTIDHRVTCPECDSNETERIEIVESRNPVESGTTLVENRSCNNCYEGYQIKYEATGYK